jgi:hypothetical protein
METHAFGFGYILREFSLSMSSEFVKVAILFPNAAVEIIEPAECITTL